jgi:hypothetical protein
MWQNKRLRVIYLLLKRRSSHKQDCIDIRLQQDLITKLVVLNYVEFHISHNTSNYQLKRFRPKHNPAFTV